MLRLIVLVLHIMQIQCFLETTPLEPEIGPRGMPHNQTTNCRDFGKFARFNPYSVVDYQWFTFFYWSTPKPPMSFTFRVPSKRDTHYLHYLMDNRVADNFNWSARMLLMTDYFDNTTTLLVENGDRGQYQMYLFDELASLPVGGLLTPKNIRIKQVGDNKYIGVMICKLYTAYILSKIDDVPPKERLHEEAAKLGYRGRKGKSYLYQGHDFMPIPEADEKAYWRDFYARSPKMFDAYMEEDRRR